MFENYDEETAPACDRIAWALCQIIDDDAPLRWRRYRFAAECIANNEKLMMDLAAMRSERHRHRDEVDITMNNTTEETK